MPRSRADAGSQAPPTDEALVAAIREGDADAWRELVLRYETLVMSIPLRMGLSHEDAEEVFQSTWRTLFQHVQSIRDPGRVVFWVRTTARREAWRKGQERSVDAMSDSDLDALTTSSDDGLDPAEELDRRDMNRTVLVGLEQLDPRCRLLLTRLFLDQPTPAYADLGAELEIPIGSIGPTRIRCLEKLAEILGARGTDD